MTLNGALDNDRPIEILDAEKEKLDKLNKKIQYRRYYKIGGTIFAGSLTYLLTDVVFFKLYSILFIKNVSVFPTLFNLMTWIPDNFQAKDVLTNDFLFPAWDITNKNPLFFSNHVGKDTTNTNDVYNMSFKNMTLASATNPNYFTSANITYPITDDKNGSHQFFGGNTVAASPSLYSHFLTSHFIEIPISKIRMVTVGNLYVAPERLAKNVGIVGWASRLYTLTDPVKKRTQNYMIEHILRANNQ